MKFTKTILILAASLSLVGCASTRSISNSSYHANYDQRRELSELDVLGINPEVTVSDQDIADALARSAKIKLRPGSNVLLIQSGAVFPDKGMVSAMAQHFSVVPFSGSITEKAPLDANPLSKSLRLAAAQAGAETIVCYWGILESGTEKMATKTVSWVPVVNWVVPDEKQHMRIRLKIAVVDVRSGAWSMLSPEAIEDKRISTSPRREATDQKQVERLKEQVYVASVKELISRHAGL